MTHACAKYTQACYVGRLGNGESRSGDGGRELESHLECCGYLLDESCPNCFRKEASNESAAAMLAQ
jgi:hypothetical protein